MSNNSHLLLLLLLPSLLFHACNKLKMPEEPESGVSWQLAQARKAKISDLRYNLDITVPKSKQERLKGRATISFQLKKKDKVVLDFKVPKEYLYELRMGAQTIPYTFENGHIIIAANYFKKGENSIDLAFDLGDQSLNRQDDFLYTLLVPDRASTAFPCFDQPNLKAKYKLSLTIPQEWKALANGTLEEEQQQDSTQTLTFAETRPLPSYLFDFVVGDFQVIRSEVGGRSMIMLHRETDTASVQRNVAAIFDLHLTALNWLEDYTGIEMPFQKFDFALIPSFQYGGMEHPGAITYKASSLFLDENATQNQELGRASLIAHETAHMWFGNLVTMNWFDDVWMKEVFANFMAAKIVNPSFPEINHDLRFLLAHYPSAYGIDRSAGAHPIQQELGNLKNAGTLYGAIIYQKAPIAMWMLEKEIGKPAMQRGLQEYLQKYAYNNATWDDLIAILDLQSEEDLESWNKQWIKQAGMPHISVDIGDRESPTFSGIKIEQTNLEDEKEWFQYLHISSLQDSTIDSFLIKQEQVSISSVFDTTYAQPQLIIPNADGYGYGYFELDERSKTFLLQNINQLENSIHRGVSWLSLWENMLHNQVQPIALLESLLDGIKIEEDPLIRQRMLAYIRGLYWKFLSESERQTMSTPVENVLWAALQQTADNRQKTALFNTYRAIAESDEGVNQLLAIWNKTLNIDGLSLSENDYTDLVFQLAVRDIPNSQRLLVLQQDRISNADRKARINFIMPALSIHESVRDSFFNSLMQEENRQVESWVQQALGWLHHPLRATSSEKYITPTLELLEEIQTTGDIFFPKRVLDNTFRGHRSPNVVQAVEAFLAARPDYPESLRNKILQASDLTFRAAKTDL